MLAERLLAPVVRRRGRRAALGCTHYPYLGRAIGDVMGPEVTLVVERRRDRVRGA